MQTTLTSRMFFSRPQQWGKERNRQQKSPSTSACLFACRSAACCLVPGTYSFTAAYKRPSYRGCPLALNVEKFVEVVTHQIYLAHHCCCCWGRRFNSNHNTSSIGVKIVIYDTRVWYAHDICVSLSHAHHAHVIYSYQEWVWVRIGYVGATSMYISYIAAVGVRVKDRGLSWKSKSWKTRGQFLFMYMYVYKAGESIGPAHMPYNFQTSA